MNNKKKPLRHSSASLRKWDTPTNSDKLRGAMTENEAVTLDLLRTLNQNIRRSGEGEVPRAKHALGAPPAVLLVGDFEPHSHAVMSLLKDKQYIVTLMSTVQQAMEEMSKGRHYRLVIIAKGTQHSNALIADAKERGFAYTRLDEGNTAMEQIDQYFD